MKPLICMHFKEDALMNEFADFIKKNLDTVLTEAHEYCLVHNKNIAKCNPKV